MWQSWGSADLDKERIPTREGYKRSLNIYSKQWFMQEFENIRKAFILTCAEICRLIFVLRDISQKNPILSWIQTLVYYGPISKSHTRRHMPSLISGERISQILLFTDLTNLSQPGQLQLQELCENETRMNAELPSAWITIYFKTLWTGDNADSYSLMGRSAHQGSCAPLSAETFSLSQYPISRKYSLLHKSNIVNLVAMLSCHLSRT